MSALGRKLGRDLLRLKGQVLTIALVLAAGMMAMIMLRSTWASLVGARDAYYTEYRFADVFARIERAPDPVAQQLARIDGVARVYTRIVKEVMIPIDDEPSPVPGRIVSIPEDGAPPLNALYLRAGRLPGRSAVDEVVLLDQFARGHDLQPGAELPTVINGSLRRLRIVGIALSPEYVFAMSGREMMADERRFAVMWMNHDAVAAAFRMEGTFNDVAVALQPGASVPGVLDAVDRALARWGGFHAVARDKQLSNYLLGSELGQLQNLALTLPVVFLAVAAFLVNVVISRLVFLERTQIAVLKALGYRNARIAAHYLALVGLIVGIAAVAGVALGAWAGNWMTELYTTFFRFPTRVYSLSPGLVGATLGISLAAAVVGTLGAAARVVRLPPAQAMRPPAPLGYRRSRLERIGLGHLLGPSAMMIAREITRRPLRFAMSTLGIAMAVGIFILGRFSLDSFDYLMNEVFFRERRADLVVQFTSPRPAAAIDELAAIPGVLLAEGERIVPVRLRAGARWRDVAIVGYPPRSELRHLLHRLDRELALPPEGVIMSDKLAQILDLRVGDRVEAEILEGSWPVREITVSAVIEEPFGLQVYARADWLARLLREQPRVTAAMLRVDPALEREVQARLKRMPAVAGATSRARIIANYEKQTGESMSVITLILGLSAAAVAIGVVYNNARIAVSVRGRDLASLRVLGFTRNEISSILLGELGAQVAIGIPVGLVIGHWWAQLYIAGIDQEAMRIPLHIAATTYGAAALIAFGSGLVSALLVRRKLDQLDLIGVLKAAE